MRTPSRRLALVVALALVAVACTNDDGDGEAAASERYESDAFAFDHPDTLEVTETRDGQDFVRLEREVDGQLEAFVEVFEPLEPSFDAAVRVYGADEADPDLRSSERDEDVDIAGAERVVVERFVSDGVLDDRTFAFRSLVAEATSGGLVTALVGVDVEADEDIEDLERTILGGFELFGGQQSASEVAPDAEAATEDVEAPDGYEAVRVGRAVLAIPEGWLRDQTEEDSLTVSGGPDGPTILLVVRPQTPPDGPVDTVAMLEADPDERDRLVEQELDVAGTVEAVRTDDPEQDGTVIDARTEDGYELSLLLVGFDGEAEDGTPGAEAAEVLLDTLRLEPDGADDTGA